MLYRRPTIKVSIEFGFTLCYLLLISLFGVMRVFFKITCTIECL